MVFEGTLEAARLFLSNIKCLNCGEQSDYLNNIGDSCKHVFCWPCVDKLQKGNPPQCPLCFLPLVGRITTNRMLRNLYEQLTRLICEIEKWAAMVTSGNRDMAETQAFIQQTQAVLMGAFEEPRRRTVEEFIAETQGNENVYPPPQVTATQRSFPEFKEPSLFGKERPVLITNLKSELPDNVEGDMDEILPATQPMNDSFCSDIDVVNVTPVDAMDTEVILTPSRTCPIPEDPTRIGPPLSSSTQHAHESAGFPELFASQFPSTQVFTQFAVPESPMFKVPISPTLRCDVQPPKVTFGNRQYSEIKKEAVLEDVKHNVNEIENNRDDLPATPSPELGAGEGDDSFPCDPVPPPPAGKPEKAEPPKVLPERMSTRSSLNKDVVDDFDESDYSSRSSELNNWDGEDDLFPEADAVKLEAPPPSSPVLFQSQMVRNETMTQTAQQQQPFKFNAPAATSYFAKKPERGKTFGARRGQEEPEWPPARASRSNRFSIKTDENQLKVENEKTKEEELDADTPKRVTTRSRSTTRAISAASSPSPRPPSRGSSSSRSRSRASSVSRKSSRSSATHANVLKPFQLNVIGAVQAGDAKKLEKVLQQGVNVNEVDPDGRTPLYYAAAMDRMDLCDMLVQAGALINAHCGADCDTPLHVAVKNQAVHALEFLLEKGGNKFAMNIYRKKPMDLIQQSTSPMRAVLRQAPRKILQPGFAHRDCRICLPLDQGIDEKMRLGAVKMFNHVADKMGDRVTHIVVGGVDSQRAVDHSPLIVEAMARGLFVMSSTWLEQSLKRGTIVDETPFEVRYIRQHGTIITKTDGKCTTWRKSKALLKPPLFIGAQFYMASHRYAYHDRDYLKTIIVAAGGKIVSREPVPNVDDPRPFHDDDPVQRTPYYFLMCPSDGSTLVKSLANKPYLNVVSPLWIEESIMQHKILTCY